MKELSYKEEEGGGGRTVVGDTGEGNSSAQFLHRGSPLSSPAAPGRRGARGVPLRWESGFCRDAAPRLRRCPRHGSCVPTHAHHPVPITLHPTALPLGGSATRCSQYHTKTSYWDEACSRGGSCGAPTEGRLFGWDASPSPPNEFFNCLIYLSHL